MSIKSVVGRSKYATGVVLTAVFSAITLFPHPAFAATVAPLSNGCGFSSLGGWDWPAWTAESGSRTGTITTGSVPNFSATTWSWIIVGQGTQHADTSGGVTTEATAFTMYLASGGNNDKIVAYMDSSGNEHITTANGSGLWIENITDSSNPQVHITDLPSVLAANNSTYSDIQLNGSGGVVNSTSYPGGQCVAMSNNIIYASTWTDPKYTVGGSWTSGVGGPGGPNCSGLNDIVCVVHNAFAGVADDFLAGIEALANFIGQVFLPNGQELASDWNGFYSTLQAKLGFLLWPFTFIGSIFNAAINPTVTCCTIPGATFFGRTMPSIDLTYASTAMPTIWAYCQDVVRGLTILLLIFGIRKKFLEITHR
jgi:hypothetical protein